MAKRYDINTIDGSTFTYQLYASVSAVVSGQTAVTVDVCHTCPPYPVPPPEAPTYGLTKENTVTNSPTCNAGANETFDAVFRVNGVVVNSVAGNFVSTNGFGSTPPCNGMPTRSSANRPNVANGTGSGIPKPNAYALYSANPTFEQLGTDPNFFYSLIAFNDFWTTPFDADIAAAEAAYAAEYAAWEADKAAWEEANHCC